MNGLFLSLILTILFISCNKDDNNSKTLVGTWACVASSDDLTIAKYNNNWHPSPETGALVPDYDDFSTYDTSITDHFKVDIVIFQEDGRWQSTDRYGIWFIDEDYPNRYLCKSIGYSFNLFGNDYSNMMFNSGSWCIIGNQLYIDKDYCVWNIKKFTKSELKISTTNEVQDSHGNKYKNRHTRTFKKQS